MNKLEKYRSYRANLNLIQASNRCGSHVNCCRISGHNTFEHENCKFLICHILNKAGYDYITEAVLNDGTDRRIDVFDIQRLLAIEVLCSETEAECDLKGYPVPIIKVKSNMKYDEIKKLIL